MVKEDEPRRTFHRLCRPGDVFGDNVLEKAERGVTYEGRESTAIPVTPVMLICFSAADFNRIASGAKANFSFDQKLEFLRSLVRFATLSEHNTDSAVPNDNVTPPF